MFRTLQVVSMVLVAVAMAQALAHALELPGKMRLAKDAYLAVQRIYYPGFSIGGIAEPLAIVALIALLAITPYGGARFWWTLAAFLPLVAMHLVYWVLIHPINNFWVKDVKLTGPGATFFSLFAHDLVSDPGADWSKARDVWEYSHLARAVFAMLSLIALAIAITG
jgi:hypothetical protein